LVASLKSSNDENLSRIGLLHNKEHCAAAIARSDVRSRPRYPQQVEYSNQLFSAPDALATCVAIASMSAGERQS
jgi:hypothetical protein